MLYFFDTPRRACGVSQILPPNSELNALHPFAIAEVKAYRS